MGTQNEDLPLGSHVRVKLKSGSTFTATLTERTDTELVLSSDVGGMRISLRENEIDNLQPFDSGQQSAKTDSSGIFTGSIKIFKQEYMWGVILAENGLDYQFNETNIADSALREKLKSSNANEILGIVVCFKPSTIRKKNGDSKDIAIEITQAAEGPLPKEPGSPSLSQLTDEDASPIPYEVKQRAYQILLREESSKDGPLLLSQAAPLLRKEGIDPKRFGYPKAKPFFLALGFVSLDESENNGAERIVLSKPESEGPISGKQEISEESPVAFGQNQEGRNDAKEPAASEPIEDDAGKPSLWQRLFGGKARSKGAESDKSSAPGRNTRYSIVSFEEHQNPSSDEAFDIAIDNAGFTPRTESLLHRGGYTTMTSLQQAMTENPFGMMRVIGQGQAEFDEVTEKVMLFMALDAYMKTANFTVSEAEKYLSAGRMPEPSFDFDKGQVFIPPFDDDGASEPSDQAPPNDSGHILPDESENRIEGCMVFFSTNGLYGQVEDDDGGKYKITRGRLDPELLVYVTGAPSKEVRNTRISFVPSTNEKTGDNIASDVQPLLPISNDPQVVIGKGHDALLHQKFQAADIFFAYAAEKGLSEEIGTLLGTYLAVCQQQPDSTKKAVRIFEKYVSYIPPNCESDLLAYYESVLNYTEHSAPRLQMLMRIIDAEIVFGRYEDAIATCDRWKEESSASKNKTKTSERAQEIDLDRAICLYHLGRLEEAQAIAEAIVRTDSENDAARRILDRSLQKPVRIVATPATISNQDVPSKHSSHQASFSISAKEALDQGRAALLEKRYEEAEPLLLYAISNGFAAAAMGDYVTLCLAQEGRAADALAILDEHAPIMAADKVRNMRISLCDKMKDYPSLIALYEEALSAETAPRKKSYFLTKIIYCHAKTGNYAAGLEACNRWEALYKQNRYGSAGESIAKAASYVELYKATCLYFTGKIDEATEIARRRVLQNPSDAIANSILNGTLAEQIGASAQHDEDAGANLSEGAYIAEDLLDSLDGNGVIQNQFVVDLIKGFDITPRQLTQRISDGRYVGSISEAEADVADLLKRKRGGPGAAYENRLAACRIMTHFMVQSISNGEELPWGDASLARTAARAMLYWADRHVQMGQQDSSRMAYLFVVGNLPCTPQSGLDDYWKNACDSYLHSYYSGASLSSYIANRGKPPSIDQITNVFLEESLPEAILPGFVVGLIELTGALSNQPDERSKIEEAVFTKNPELKAAIVEQLSILLDTSAIEVSDRGSFSLALDKARVARGRKIGQLTQALLSIAGATSFSKAAEEALAIVRSTSWRSYCCETDVDRFEALERVLSELARYSDKFDFEGKSGSLRRSLSELDELRRDIKEGPTEYAYNTILPIIDSIVNTLSSKLAELYEENQPKLTWEVKVQPHLAQDGLYRVQLVVTNGDGCQPADAITVGLADSFEADTLSIEKCSQLVKLPGGMGIEVIMMIRISDEAVKTGSFTLPLRYSFQSRDSAGDAPTQKERRLELPLVILEKEFEPFKNPYAAYGGGSPITNENDKMFYGRETEKKKLVEMVRQGERMNYGCAIAMYGQTRTGKSSLLGQVRNAIVREYGNRVVLCDLGNIGSIQTDKDNPNRFLAEFLYQILLECCDSVENNDLVSQHIDPNELDPPLEMLDKPTHAMPLFHRHMKRLDRALREAGAIVLLIIDEFTYLHSLIKSGQVTENFMRLWKAMLQDYCIFAIVVGQDDMPEFRDEYPNEFACMDTIKLTYLEETAAKKLIREPLERVSGREGVFQKEAVNALYRLTAGSAFLTMKLCSRLVDFLNERQIRIVTPGIISAFIHERVFGPSSFIEEKDFEPQLKERGHPEYDAATKGILYSIASTSSSTNVMGLASVKQIECEGLTRSEIGELCERLVNRNVLIKDGGRYRIQVQLLTLWLIETMGDEQ